MNSEEYRMVCDELREIGRTMRYQLILLGAILGALGINIVGVP